MISNIFHILNSQIEGLLNSSNAEAQLIDLYFEFWKELKEHVGTSAGFTGLSEYLFFAYIKKYIEQKHKTIFHPESVSKDIKIFRTDSLIITHGLDLSKIIKLRKMQPDIAVVSHRDGNRKLIAAFEIKIFISSPKILEELLERSTYLLENTDSFVFPIIFLDQHRNSMDAFCSVYKGRASIISKAPYKHSISLNDAIEAFLTKAKT